MSKQRMTKVFVGLALLLAITSASGVVADSLGLAITSPAHACSTGSSSGGGC